MKEIRLKKIILNGFRGQNREIAFNDSVTALAGANGTGKTTIYVAAKWCLTGTDELNRANYALFDDTLEFSHENSAPAVVELYIEIDGTEYILKRQATPKWVRKRGSAEYVKAPSDEYRFYVDGFEYSATAYKDYVNSLFDMDVEKLKLCIDVLYYQLLDWKDLRKHFADVVGEITDSDLSGDYTAIYPYLDKFKSGDKAKEFLRQQINPLKSQIRDLDADIKAAERMLPDLAPVDKAERVIAEKKNRIAEINKEILGLEEANKPYIEKRKAELACINDLKREYEDKKLTYEAIQRSSVSTIQDELDKAKAHNADIDSQAKRNAQIVANHKSEIKLCKEDIEDLKSELEHLRLQNKELKSREFSDTTCPNCGQELPIGMIAEMRAAFYEDIDKQREPIVERGRKISARLEVQKARLEKLESEEVILTDSAATRIDTDEIQRRLKQASFSILSYADTDEAKSIMQQIDKAKAELTVVPEIDSIELQDESNRLVSDIAELSKIAARREVYETCMNDIETYKAQKHETGIELAKWEGLLDKFMSREREWADIVRDRANKYLEYSHVEMIDISKSGELVDTCTLTINGIDRGVTNHANKTLIGIDISNAICKRYGVLLPLFIDDFEHFTAELTYTGDRQVITLSADKHYDELTIL